MGERVWGCPLDGTRDRHSILQGIPWSMSSPCPAVLYPGGHQPKTPLAPPKSHKENQTTEKNPKTQRNSFCIRHLNSCLLVLGVFGVPGAGGRTGRWLHFPTLGAKAAARVLGRAGLGKAEASEGLPLNFLPACSCPKPPFPPRSQGASQLPAAGGRWEAARRGRGCAGISSQRGAGNAQGTPGYFGRSSAMGMIFREGTCPAGNGDSLHSLFSKAISQKSARICLG